MRAIVTAAVLLAGLGWQPSREAQPPSRVLDAFETIEGWQANPSDDVLLTLGQDAGAHGRSMRLDFDFRGHGGYAVVRKTFDVALPANYELAFAIRGQAPVNTLELKLVDPSGDNVWWSNQRDFVFPREWTTVRRKKRHIEFAWGPLGGGEIRRIAAIEIAITAGSGGKGTVWIDDLTLTPLEPDAPYTLTPRVTATTTAGGTSPARAIDDDTTTAWNSATGARGDQFLEIDFLKRREFGGLTIDWTPGRRATAYEVRASTDGRSWQTLYSVERGGGARDHLYLPESDARYLRLALRRGADASGYGVREITVQPLPWSASKNDFFRAVARDAAPGSYPRSLSDVMSYWTVVGVDGDAREGLVNEEGMIETGKGQFSIEPFLRDGGRLVTWRDATTHVTPNAALPAMAGVEWETPTLRLAVSAMATGARDSSVLIARYVVANRTREARRVTLHLAMRPFQVNPPWQFLNMAGGVARIDSVSYDGGIVRVNGDRLIVPFSPPRAFGAATFDEGNVVDFLRSGRLPPRTSVRDRFGHASAALAFDIALPPGDSAEPIYLAIPLHASASARVLSAARAPSARTWPEERIAETSRYWDSTLAAASVQLPTSGERLAGTLRTTLAHILINRDGPAIQPGSRSYERSWIRDGALTSAALLRLGHPKPVREFLEWYAGFQFDNGKIPCCVDARGADPVPENDSQGEFIYLAAEYFRHTGDTTLLARLWPRVARATAFMDSLRRSRMTAEYQAADKRAYYGLMPQSISHEGYSAKPMHSYWDDFFALRGFKDAAEVARVLRKPEATRYATMRDEFRRDLYESIRRAMAMHRIDYIPGAVELGDFDATSTTIAVAPVDELGHLPRPALDRTFAKYLENFRARRDGTLKSEAYTPYELRVVGTFVRLGQKAHAHELLDFFYLDQRPEGWLQWAEVVFADPDAPKFIGDMPHTWVGSDFIRSALDMLAYEREQDSSIVVGAGVLESWVREEPPLAVRRLSTHYGPLSYSMRADGADVEVRIASGVRMPPGGLVVRSPLDRPIRSATVNGATVPASATEVIVRRLPATVTLRY